MDGYFYLDLWHSVHQWSVRIEGVTGFLQLDWWDLLGGTWQSSLRKDVFIFKKEAAFSKSLIAQLLEIDGADGAWFWKRRGPKERRQPLKSGRNGNGVNGFNGANCWNKSSAGGSCDVGSLRWLVAANPSRLLDYEMLLRVMGRSLATNSSDCCRVRWEWIAVSDRSKLLERPGRGRSSLAPKSMEQRHQEGFFRRWTTLGLTTRIGADANGSSRITIFVAACLFGIVERTQLSVIKSHQNQRAVQQHGSFALPSATTGQSDGTNPTLPCFYLSPSRSQWPSN